MGAISRWSRAATGRRVDCFGKDDSYRHADGVVVDIIDMVAKDAVKWANAIEMDTSYGDLVKRKT